MSLEDIEKLLAQQSVAYFSRHVFGREYADIAIIIYPRPKYRYFSLRKKSGGIRVIASPRSYLKQLQYQLLEYMAGVIDPPKSCVHGFTPGRSIVSNAQAHALPRTSFLLNIDLEDFFPSISFPRVKGMFEGRPFNLSRSVATVCAQICCANGGLVQGAPTSPLISNLICRGLDNSLKNLAKHHGAIYTRYCDDITFSFRTSQAQKLPAEICKYDGEILEIGQKLEEEIAGAGFNINSLKSRISSKYRRMEVTGLTINSFPNVQRKFIDSIRGALHSWEKFGYERASAEWEVKPYGRQRRSGRPSLANNLYGRLLFVAMVRGKDDRIYIKLAERYNKLVGHIGDVGVPMKALPIARVMKSLDDAQRIAFVIESRSGYDSDGLWTNEKQGTGFLVVNDVVLTCEHVVHHVANDTRYFLIEPERDKSYELHLVADDVKRDVAALRFINDKPLGIIPLVFSRTPATTRDTVTLLGFPAQTKGRSVAVIPTHVASYFLKAKINRIDLTNPIRQGNSGGPLVNSFYELVGMATEGATVTIGNNECLCGSEIQNWLLEVDLV